MLRTWGGTGAQSDGCGMISMLDQEQMQGNQRIRFIDPDSVEPRCRPNCGACAEIPDGAFRGGTRPSIARSMKLCRVTCRGSRGQRRILRKPAIVRALKSGLLERGQSMTPLFVTRRRATTRPEGPATVLRRGPSPRRLRFTRTPFWDRRSCRRFRSREFVFEQDIAGTALIVR